MASTQSSRTFPVDLLVVLCLGLMLTHVGCQAETRLFRSLFSRTAGQALSSVASHSLANCTTEACAQRCVEELASGCKSFDYHSATNHCKLYSVDIHDPDVKLIDSEAMDHYETVYRNLFNRLPKHRLSTIELRESSDVTVEECARGCVVETSFKCKGFNYKSATRTCVLLEQTPSDSNGAVRSPDSDYYERGPDGVLAHFINYGHREMQPMATAEIYQKVVLGIALADCASRCLVATEFQCVSFDYTYAGVRSTCSMSKYIAANVYGLGFRSNVRNNHYEKIGDAMSYFYATPYAVVLGSNLKTYTRVTPNRCARMCLEEDTFVCKSFDYQIQDGMCLLSDKAASDVGGLYSDGQSEAHHFEMIPMMDCGGTMTTPEGNFASPNWPWPYAHNEHCVWRIYVSQFKVIHLRLSHFELALGSADSCSPTADRLVVSESTEDEPCGVKPHTKTIVTKGNFAIVTFTSNDHGDAKGFRAFYTAEWTCNVHLSKGPGELASPSWPENYPPSIRCSWRLTAPPGQRVHLHVTAFDLEEHALGHCNDHYDHVRILDGGTVTSTKIGLYCGRHKAFSVRSTGRDMFVQFVSDHDPNSSKQGFHAIYQHEKSHNGNDSSLPTSPFDGTATGWEEVKLDQDKNSTVKEHVESRGWKTGRGEEKAYHPKTNAVRGEGMSINTAHQAYKTAVWAVACLFFLLLMITLAALFLMWRYYRRKLVKQQEVQAYERVSPEEVPLQEFDSSCTKQNNLNDSELASPPKSSCQGAVGGFDPNLTQDHFESKDMIVKTLNDSELGSPSTSSCQGAVGGFDPNLTQDHFESKDMIVKNINELMNC